MRNIAILAAIALSGCGGGMTPETYDLVVSYFTLPDSCYSSGMQPSSVATIAPPDYMQVQVWDGPENTAFMQIEKGANSIDMGAAPKVSLAGTFTGKKADKGGWTFSSDASEKATLPGNNVVTTTTHAEITFERGGGTSKGTGAVSSSRNCVGNQCPGANPSCSVAGIVVQSTRIAVDYQRAP